MIIHLIHSPVSAKRFVEPLVNASNAAGLEAELWLENRSRLADFTAAISCPRQFVELDLSLNPFAIIRRIIKLIRRFRKIKPQAVHCHQSRASSIPLFSAFLAGVPVRIYHNHGIPYLGYRGPVRWTLWLLEAVNCFLATNVLTVAPTIMQKMIQDKIVSKEKIQCLGAGSVCGIDLDEFKVGKFSDERRKEERRKMNIAPDAFVVLYIGRPLKRKGFDTLLKAWQIFCRSQPKAEKILFAAGCDLNNVVKAAKACPIGVVPLGYVTELERYYTVCNVVTLPSWHEGMPYSLLEGAAAQRALVASNITGIDSLIKHNRNGLLAAPKKPDEFAQAFNLLYTKPQLRTELGTNAREDIEKLFNRKISTKLLLNYYNSCLNK
jgi:N,N'-diacetylbacillosaminyl-diphospho-undecaprenol alpha-1,3-N-acetylgalactosaminyltransferase